MQQGQTGSQRSQTVELERGEDGAFSCGQSRCSTAVPANATAPAGALFAAGRSQAQVAHQLGVARHMWKLLLRRLHYRLQRPARRAVERDEQAIQRWVASDWPRIRQKRP